MTPTIQYRVGDVFDRLAEIPDNSIDLIVSSPPFLALRSYLPADHPDKGKEIGQEPTPAAFIRTHLELAAEYARVLAPHGSLCYEIGDTYSGSGGAGGDYNADGLRDGQDKFKGSAGVGRTGRVGKERDPQGFTGRSSHGAGGGNGWPQAKSMCIIPHMFTGSLAYGRNLLDPDAGPSPAGEWKIRNVICWARPNPPVGALGDKFRPATSYITVACKSGKRYFDLDAVRTEFAHPEHNQRNGDRGAPTTGLKGVNTDRGDGGAGNFHSTTAGAPPLDWHADNHPEDGDWLWKLSTQPYRGAHFATFPMALPKKLIEAMCPRKVCNVCGVPSTRIVEHDGIAAATDAIDSRDPERLGAEITGKRRLGKAKVTPTGTWTDCGHDDYRTGVVLDPFGGSGTTAEAAQALGRSAILIDLDDRNADLARQRVGMFLEIDAA